MKYGFLIALGAAFLDQLSKAVVLQCLTASSVISLTPFLNFIAAWNRGVSFSFLAVPSDTVRWFLVGLTTILSLIVASLMHQAKTHLSIIGYAFILGGAIGNLLDRIRFGAVFDFIDVVLYKWHFYTFNGADSFITIGVACLLLDYMWAPTSQKRL